MDRADAHDRNGAELFAGVNPRAREGKGKDAVTNISAYFVDLDLPDVETQDSAPTQIHDAERSALSLSVYGLNVVYILSKLIDHNATWKSVLRGLVHG